MINEHFSKQNYYSKMIENNTEQTKNNFCQFYVSKYKGSISKIKSFKFLKK